MLKHNSLVVVTLLVASAALLISGQSREENEIDGYFVERPRGRCVSGYDCQPTECSVMGMQRFSEPRCEPLGRMGDPCRPGAEADNKTLHFPSQIMECEDVYMQFCPCAKGLVCREGECRRPMRRQPIFSRRQNLWQTSRRIRQSGEGGATIEARRG